MKVNNDDIEEVIAEQLSIESVHGDITVEVDHINIIDRTGELVDQLTVDDESEDSVIAGDLKPPDFQAEYEYCGLCGDDLEGENEIITGVCDDCALEASGINHQPPSSGDESIPRSVDDGNE